MLAILISPTRGNAHPIHCISLVAMVHSCPREYSKSSCHMKVQVFRSELARNEIAMAKHTLSKLHDA